MGERYLVAADVVLPNGKWTKYQLYIPAESKEEAEQSFRVHCSIEPKICITSGLATVVVRDTPEPDK